LLKPLTNLRHSLAHRLGWQLGHVVSGWSGGALWIGFQCDQCGEVTGAHIAEYRSRGSGLDPIAQVGEPAVWSR
jgi:hypothetical protein